MGISTGEWKDKGLKGSGVSNVAGWNENEQSEGEMSMGRKKEETTRTKDRIREIAGGMLKQNRNIHMGKKTSRTRRAC